MADSELSAFCLNTMRSARIDSVPCVMITLPVSAPPRACRLASPVSPEKLIGFLRSACSACAGATTASAAHERRSTPAQRRAGGAQRRKRCRRSGFHFGRCVGLQRSAHGRLEPDRAALLSRTIPTPWIIPRASSIVTSLSVSARDSFGMTRSISVVNVASPTGFLSRADGRRRVARRADVAAQRDDLPIAGDGAEFGRDRETRGLPGSVSVERRQR